MPGNPMTDALQKRFPESLRGASSGTAVAGKRGERESAAAAVQVIACLSLSESEKKKKKCTASTARRLPQNNWMSGQLLKRQHPDGS